MKERKVKEYKVEVYDNGDKFWFNKDGQAHCEHGAAVENDNGDKWYYLNGVCLSKAQWEKQMKKPSVTEEEVEKARVHYYDTQAAAEAAVEAAWDKYEKLKREYEGGRVSYVPYGSLDCC